MGFLVNYLLHYSINILYLSSKLIEGSENIMPHIRLLIGFGCTFGLGVFIWAGFNTSQYRIDICRSEVSKYVTAEYSEMISGVDMNGNFYSEMDTWSERASETYKNVAVNEMVDYPPMPEHDISLKKEPHFDGFRFHTNGKLTVEAFSYTDRTIFTEDISKSTKCLSKLDQYVDIKTWWSVSYGSDFDA